ncbi:WD40-repeat-containing domain protein [Phlyctochytrium arcticum]|nr:WD40-repeat-containing domain protein [Phlyctochytrium arcticum]
MDSFFMADPDSNPSAAQRKRKKQLGDRKMRRNKEDDAPSDDEGGAVGVDDMDLIGDRHKAVEDSDDDPLESAAQKRSRLAKRYLSKVREDTTEKGEVDAAQMDREIIAQRLKTDELEKTGRMFYALADRYSNFDFEDPSHVTTLKCNNKVQQLSITSIAISKAPHRGDKKTVPAIFIYSASKDAAIVKWNFWTGKIDHTFAGGLKPTKKLTAAYGKKLPAAHIGHNDHILAVAASSDGKYVATGGRDKAIHIWSVEGNKNLTTFKQHRDAVCGLAFRRGQNQLYSASMDRTIKIWNIDELSYVETLFGHQDSITCIDTIMRERCITSGARDRTLRLWKIPEESQLVFRGGGMGTASSAGEDLVVMDGMRKAPKVDKQAKLAGGSLDAVALLDEEYFISGSDTGAISLWSINRKKPLFTKLRAHGPDSRIRPPADVAVSTNGNKEGAVEMDVDETAGNVTEPLDDGACWITAIATVRHSDMFASGAGDGYIRFWKVAKDKRRFTLMGSIPVTGYVNSLTFFQAPPRPKSGLTIAQNSDSVQIPIDDDQKVYTAKERLAMAKAALASGEYFKPKDAEQLYLAAGVGQEHRLGRWFSTFNQAASKIKSASQRQHYLPAIKPPPVTYINTPATMSPPPEPKSLQAQLEDNTHYKVISTKEAYRRYISIWDRRVEYPDGRVIDWDVVGHDLPNPCFSVVFPFNTENKTTSLIVEYAQGPNAMLYTFAAGGFDPKKHESIMDTGKQELSEESRLTGGRWISLMPEGHEGICEVKWSRNQFIPFLVLDPIIDTNPRDRDAEELIEVRHNVTMDELNTIILQGKLMLPSVQTAWIALDYLRKQGLL